MRIKIYFCKKYKYYDDEIELTEKMICQDNSATDTGVFSESEAIDFGRMGSSIMGIETEK